MTSLDGCCRALVTEDMGLGSCRLVLTAVVARHGPAFIAPEVRSLRRMDHPWQQPSEC